jgi:hypothetical protein
MWLENNLILAGGTAQQPKKIWALDKTERNFNRQGSKYDWAENVFDRQIYIRDWQKHWKIYKTLQEKEVAVVVVEKEEIKKRNNSKGWTRNKSCGVWGCFDLMY